MGVGSAISGCLGKVATVFTDRRLRLRFFVVLSTLLEIVTAVIASLQAKKIQGLITHLETDNGVSATDNTVMAYTLLVCNCSAEAILIVIHFVYGCMFVFTKSCFGRCCSGSRAATSQLSVLVTMTLYTSILSLALAGPLQIYDKVFKNFPDIPFTQSGFTWTSTSDYPLYAVTFALFYACGCAQFLLALVLFTSRSVLLEGVPEDDEPVHRPSGGRNKQFDTAPPTDAEEGGGGFFGRFRGGGRDAGGAPAPMEPPPPAPPMRSAENPLFGGGMPSLPAKPPTPSMPAPRFGGGDDGGNPFEGGGGGSSGGNPWGAPSSNPWGDDGAAAAASRGAQLYTEMSRR